MGCEIITKMTIKITTGKKNVKTNNKRPLQNSVGSRKIRYAILFLYRLQMFVQGTSSSHAAQTYRRWRIRKEK
jgi:hypothetical protein